MSKGWNLESYLELIFGRFFFLGFVFASKWQILEILLSLSKQKQIIKSQFDVLRKKLQRKFQKDKESFRISQERVESGIIIPESVQKILFQDDVAIFVSQKNLDTVAQTQEMRFGDIDRHTFITFLVIQDFGHYGYS